MKTGIYSVLDTTAKIYSSPIMLLNDDVAVRIMKNCVSNPEHNYGLNPEDYHLYRMGHFDDNTGEITYEVEKVVSLLALSNKPNLHSTDQEQTA